MIALTVVGAYVCIWLVYGWRLALRLLENKQIENRARYHYADIVASADRGARGDALMEGFFLALLWPVTMPIRGAYRLLSGRGLMTTGLEKREAREAELKALRVQAEEYGLPMIGDEK